VSELFTVEDLNAHEHLIKPDKAALIGSNATYQIDPQGTVKLFRYGRPLGAVRNEQGQDVHG
jgi:hypothetical protein